MFPFYQSICCDNSEKHSTLGQFFSSVIRGSLAVGSAMFYLTSCYKLGANNFVLNIFNTLQNPFTRNIVIKIMDYFLLSRT